MFNPWLPYIVSEYIKLIIKPKTVFEWGSGESTLFFLEIGCNVLSIEHDPEYYKQFHSIVEVFKPKIEYYLISYENKEIGSDKSNPDHYKSGSTELGKVNFRDYASIIDKYDLFDLILIDGMARPSCLKHAMSHVKKGGCIVLDNTGDRPYYLEKTAHWFGNYESGWETVKFMGYGPILDYKWETTIFINNQKSDYENT